MSFWQSQKIAPHMKPAAVRTLEQNAGWLAMAVEPSYAENVGLLLLGRLSRLIGTANGRGRSGEGNDLPMGH